MLLHINRYWEIDTSFNAFIAIAVPCLYRKIKKYSLLSFFEIDIITDNQEFLLQSENKIINYPFQQTKNLILQENTG